VIVKNIYLIKYKQKFMCLFMGVIMIINKD